MMDRAAHHTRYWIVGMVLILALIGVVSGLAQSGGEDLFTAIPSEALLPESDPAGPEVLRARYAGINLRIAERQSRGGRMLLGFFEDATYTFIVDEIQRGNGSITLIGRAEGVENSLVALTFGGGQLVADLISPRAVFQARYVSEGIYVIRQIDQSAYPDELPPVEVDAAAGDSPAQNALPEAMTIPYADDGSRIDVLVIYTALARSQASGVTAIQNLINQAVSVTNQTYAQSGVIQRIALAGISETSYVESGDMEEDLERLANPADGYMDNIHSLRDNYKADLVSLMVGSGHYCGVAYQMSNVNAGFADLAFSVVLQECAVSYLSFAHELGHNMGARHDWYMDNFSVPYTYSHGHINPASRWRTIMSYDNYCNALGFTCNRISYWSNPTLLYGGNPLGIPQYTCIGSVGCDADNARTLNNTRITVANFRVGAPPTATPTPTQTPTPTTTPTPTPTPPYRVLLVDEDDDNPDVRAYFTNPLATVKATVTPWSVSLQGEPNATQMAPNEALIWFTGDNWISAPGPNPTTEGEIISWLETEGGCFLITSQDYAYYGSYPSSSELMQSYLKVGSVDDLWSLNKPVQTIVTGAGHFVGLGSYPLSMPPTYDGNYSDLLVPQQSAQVAFMGDQGAAGIYFEGPGYKTAYWGFALEMIPSTGDRTAILERFLRWCRVWEIYLPLIKR